VLPWEEHGGKFANFIVRTRIVFTFLYTVFYNCHHPLGFLKGEEFYF